MQIAMRSARAALSTVPVPTSFWERAFPKDVLALGYHMISDEDLPHLRLYPHKNVREFEDDVAFVQGRTIEYADLVSHRLHGTALPPNRFLFTFDDGFAECFNVVRPILHKYGVGGVFFVATDFIDDRTVFYETKVSLCITEIVRMEADRIRDVLHTIAGTRLRTIRWQINSARLSSIRISAPLSEEHRQLLALLLSLDRDNGSELDLICEVLKVDAIKYTRQRKIFMTSDELKTLAAEGFTIGGHGLSHNMLQRMSRDRIEQEIVSSCQTVRDITGQRRVPFAFPYSGRGIDRNFLTDILARYPFIEIFFDSGPLRRGAAYVVDRVWAEDATGALQHSNLPLMLRYAWLAPSAWFRAKSGSHQSAKPALPANPS
jgi:peptidoglycan/xylan/chitin deacetylase (PgdA/CDA1 family)